VCLPDLADCRVLFTECCMSALCICRDQGPEAVAESAGHLVAATKRADSHTTATDIGLPCRGPSTPGCDRGGCHARSMSAADHLEILSAQECVQLLNSNEVGRLCVVDGDFPLAFPVNYRLAADADGAPVIVVRTRPDSVLDKVGAFVGFEIDGIDARFQCGWSVVVRGRLEMSEELASLSRSGASCAWDPQPWVGERHAWLTLTPLLITGRRLIASTIEWAFEARAYL
jgi:uncharacterized protein